MNHLGQRAHKAVGQKGEKSTWDHGGALGQSDIKVFSQMGEVIHGRECLRQQMGGHCNSLDKKKLFSYLELTELIQRKNHM